EIPYVKPAVVNGVIRDTVQNIVPNTLNGVLKQVQSGIHMTLPDYLPYPLNQVDMNLAATIRNDLSSRNIAGGRGLTATVDTAMTATNTAGNPRPPAPLGWDSYVQTKLAG